jgi:uncharacterized protein YbjT (DUF2867 family)
MIILLAGSHGVTGQLLIPLLAQGGHSVRAMVRDPAQAPAVAALGGEPLIADLEADCADAAADCDAIMFAAGAGAGSGTARKETVDHAGAVKLIDAAKAHGARRYVMLSAINAENPESYDGDSDSMRVYLVAKSKADQVLRASGLDYTIVRPGRLTDEPATGRVEIAPIMSRSGSITRADVAAVMAATLELENTVGKTFDLLAGETPIGEALRAL